jgi:hypothetical protein
MECGGVGRISGFQEKNSRIIKNGHKSVLKNRQQQQKLFLNTRKPLIAVT